MTAPLTSAEAERRIANDLAVFDAAAKNCPARKTALGDKPSPKCRATTSDGCGVEVGAAYAFIEAVRAALKTLESDNG